MYMYMMKWIYETNHGLVFFLKIKPMIALPKSKSDTKIEGLSKKCNSLAEKTLVCTY